jgi:Putative adhesin
MVRSLCLAAAAVTLMLNPGSARAQNQVDAPTFDWSGAIPAGGTLHLADVDGNIRVTATTSNQAKVHGERTHVRSGERALVFQVVTSGSDVTVCALHRDGECDQSGAHSRDHDHWENYGESPRADLTVELPAGVRLAAHTGDGGIDIKDAGADVVAKSGDGTITIAGAAGTVDARSGDGDITLSGVKGSATAHTGDGNIQVSAGTAPVKLTSGDGRIEVHVGATGDGQSVSAHTGDGSITVYLPASFVGEVEATTGDGRLQSDFPLTIDGGRMDGHHLRGTVGTASVNSARVTLSTGDGDVELKKA